MTTRTRADKISDQNVQELRGQILRWYDAHKRILPWREEGKNLPDPYHVWLSEVMLQQTTVNAVIPYYIKFLEKWPTIQDLASAPQEDVLQEWAGLGYYARARNLHACAKVVSDEHSGVFPQEEKALKSLPGIGDYTSAAIMAIAFNKPAPVMDGNIERILARYFAIKEPLPDAKKLFKPYASKVFQGEHDRPGDLAQSLMDLGAGICIGGGVPRCALCPLSASCKGYELGIAGELPYKKPKKKPVKKYGHVYWIEDDAGRVLLERRPEEGLLGGMLGFPTSDWLTDKHALNKCGAHMHSFEDTGAQIHHVFTHIDLELRLYKAKASQPSMVGVNAYEWYGIDELENVGLPGLFRKVYRMAVK